MEVIGFSQTMQWYYGGPPGFDQFLSQMPSRGTQLRWQGGGGIDSWSDPNFVGWAAGIQSGECASGSGNPDRIVMNISGGLGTDVNAWHDQAALAIANARRIYPGIRTVYLQPVVGGPGHTVCTIGVVQIRASVNEPYISQAIDRLVGEGLGVWGAHPLVHSCADYADDGTGLGHLTDTGRVNAANDIGAFYRGR